MELILFHKPVLGLMHDRITVFVSDTKINA